MQKQVNLSWEGNILMYNSYPQLQPPKWGSLKNLKWKGNQMIHH